MLRRKFLASCVLLTVCGLAGCGGSSSKTTTPDTGSVVIFVGDSPLCDVLSFRAAVQGVSFFPQGSTSGSSPFTVTPFINVNFAELQDLTTILQFGKIPVGTYDRVQIGLSLPQFAIFDSSVSPPVTYISNPNSDTNTIYNIEPPLVVTKDQLSGVRIDLDLRHSITVDTQGQVTGVGTPAIKVSPVTANGSNGFGTLEDIRGFVLSITNYSTVSQFTGSFTMQLLSGTAAVPDLNVSLTPDTQLTGVSGLNQLPGGSYVEINGYVDSQGNLVAKSVDVEDQENVSTNRMALIGKIMSITRDANGNPTEFDLFVANEQPEFATTIPLDHVVQVDLFSTTRYAISSQPVNFASLPFDATALDQGQGVVVHGPSTTASDGTISVAAESVYLRLQTHEGNFLSLISAGSDDRTGAFWMAPCCTLLQGQRFLVLTNNQTQFLNVSGLSALTSVPSILVKGLLFLDEQGGTVNGVTVPAHTPVFLADQVHELP
jgi:Domain of unknown function (DUF4382)